jgi:pimeloyl-ACP methyl ester carboxylesterase
LLRALANRGRRAVALDLPGFGTADRLGPGLIMPQLEAATGELCERVARGDAATGESGAIVVGNSLGGQVALRLAMEPNLPVAWVCPIAPAGVHTPGWVALVQHDPIIRVLLRIPTPVKLPAGAVRGLLGNALSRLAFAEPVEGDHIRYFAGHYRTLASVRELHVTLQRLLPELRPAMPVHGIRVPVLMVWGDRDRLISRAGLDRVVEAAPGGEFVLYPGCGHCPQHERTSELADLICGRNTN